MLATLRSQGLTRGSCGKILRVRVTASLLGLPALLDVIGARCWLHLENISVASMDSKYRSCCPSSIASARYRLCSSYKNARSRILAVLLPNMLRLSEKIDCEHKVNMNLFKGWTPSIQACLHFSPRQEARASTGDWPLTRRRSIHLRREACFSLKPQAPSSAPPTGASSLLQGCPKTIRPSLR